MSTNQRVEGNTENLEIEKDDAFKILKENCQNFLKMSQDEKSEGIKINYLLGLIKLSNNLKIDSNTFISTVFDEILFKDSNILKNRNILSNFISALESYKNPELFEKKFFELLNKFGSDYNTNSIYFHQYLIDISLHYIFNSSFKCQEKTDYITLIIENDIKPFETQLLKNVINKNKKLIDENENKTFMVQNLYNKFISMNKYKSCIIIFFKILENVNNIIKKIPKEIIFEIIKTTNNIGFNHVIKKTKEINDFLIFNCLLLDNLDEKLFVSEEELEMFDFYLINLLNLLSLKKDLNIEIFQKIYNYYNTQKYKNLKKVFPDVLYYLSSYSYFNSQYEFLFNCLNSAFISPIYIQLISHHLLSLNKKPINYKEGSFTKHKNIKFNIVDDDLDADILLDDNLFLFDNINNNISFLNHLNIYSYIINTSFSVVKTYNRITINFYPKVLNRILTLLNNLSLENSNKKYFELLLFILDVFSIIINYYISINEFIFKEDYLFTSLLKTLEKTSTDNKYLIIFPSLINLIKTSLINSYDILTSNNSNNKLYNFLFDSLITNFSNNNNNTINNSQQIILIFKSLVILFSDKKTTKNQKLFFCLDKLIDLVIKSNNKDIKLFESFYKLCKDLQKSPDVLDKHLSNYAMNKYSKNINNYLNDSFCDFIVDKFNEIFIQKRPNNIVFDESTYFVVNTIDNIYNNEKLDNEDNENKINKLNELINDFCGSKLIIGVIDNLFISIEKNECDILTIIDKDKGKDTYSKYNKLNKALNDLDYYIYIYDNYFDNNIQNNKASMCHYGILKSLAHLLSGYLSNYISSALQETDIKENKNNEEEKNMVIFDYIRTKILLNKSLVNTSYPIFFINTVFKNKNNLHYFMVHYTNYLINKYVKENNNDQSNLMQLMVGEITEKNMAFLDYIHQNPYYILFMKDIINSFIEFDSSMLNPKKNVLKKKNSKYKIIYKYENIINKLKERGDKCLSEFDDNQKIMINSFFSKMLIDDIFEKNNPMATFENNQIIFLFLLDNSILEKYIDLFGYFINIDYILIQLYSIIRKKNISEELNEKYIHFINKYIDIENVGNYVIRSLNNKKTFENLFKCNNINKKFIFDLFNAIENVINNLSNNIHVNNDIEKAGKNILNILNEIFEHINKFYDINFNFSITEFYLFGKIIRTVLRNLNKKLHYQKIDNNNNNTNNNTIENNNSNVTDQINSVIEQVYSLTIPNYINTLYKIIISILDNKDKKINLDNSLDNIFLSFYLIIDIISGCKNDSKLFNILSEKIGPDIMNFFLNLLIFNTYNDYAINLNSYKAFKDKYDELSNNIISKKFLENLFLFSLFKGKLDEKNLKSVIIKIFDDLKDKPNDEFKKFGYMICYFLNAVKRDNNNKNYSVTTLNCGDFNLITSIGERFKEDEKSLQKKNNFNPDNLNK